MIELNTGNLFNLLYPHEIDGADLPQREPQNFENTSGSKSGFSYVLKYRFFPLHIEK